MALAGDSRGAFGRAARAVLGQWAALQIAVENGFGGAHSQEKAEWMVEAVEQYFQSNADLEPEEVADFLAEVMNNEFDTVIEDGSLSQVSQQLCLFFQQCQQGNHVAVHEALAQLAQKQQEARMAAAKAVAAEEDSSEEEEREVEEEAMECSTNGPRPSSPPPPSGLDAEDGWTGGLVLGDDKPALVPGLSSFLHVVQEAADHTVLGHHRSLFLQKGQRERLARPTGALLRGGTPFFWGWPFGHHQETCRC